MIKITPKLLNYILQAAILLGLIWAAMKYLSGDAILNTLRVFNPLLLVLLVAVAIFSFYVKAWRFSLLLKPQVKLPGKLFMKAFASGQPATLIPGGIFARVGLLAQIGVPAGASLAVILVSSLIDQVVLLTSSVIAALWVETAQPTALIFISVLVVLALLLVPLKTRQIVINLVRGLTKRFNLEKQMQHFNVAIQGITKDNILFNSLLLTLLYLALNIFTLYIAMIGIGVEVGIFSLFLAYVLPHMIGRLSVMPGGVGITEAGMLGILVTATNASPDTLTAGIVLFRIASDLLPAVLGAVVYFFFWRPHNEHLPKIKEL